MSEVNVLEMASLLPTYIVDQGKVTRVIDGEEVVIGTLTVSIEDEVEAVEKDQLEESAAKDDEGDLSWLDENKTTGEIGEILAFEYLKTIYSDVYDISEDAKMGYDIEVKEVGCVKGFEVKTSKSTIGFHISRNQLKVATEMNDNYHLFFIHEDFEEYRGYIIQNPIKEFNIDHHELTQPFNCANATIIPNSFFIKFNKGYLRSLGRIQLNQYI